jgi:hypothetical protein
MIFTHNHPQGWLYPEGDPRRLGTSFSPHDIHSAALAGMAEIRAVTSRYLFTIRPASGGAWPAADQIEPMFDLVKDMMARHMPQTLRRGMVDPRQAIADAPHMVWIDLAPVMGLQYRREPISDC